MTEWSEGIDRQISAAFVAMRKLYQSVLVKRELSQKVKLLIYWSNPRLWAVGSDQKNKIADTSGANELSPKGAWAHP